VPAQAANSELGEARSSSGQVSPGQAETKERLQVAQGPKIPSARGNGAAVSKLVVSASAAVARARTLPAWVYWIILVFACGIIGVVVRRRLTS
jgi:hypothetical protein